MTTALDQPIPQATQTSRAEVALECVGADKVFRTRKKSIHAIADLSFDLPVGQIMALVGPDGAGKTTLMRLASGLLQPDRGHVRVFGCDTVREADSVRRAIGYMPQRFGLYEDLTVRENMNLYADLQGLPTDERPERFERLLTMGGLRPFPNRLARNLSGGMKQKLGLICTLLRTPKLLLLDEPTVGVDPVSRRELWSIIAQVRREHQMTVLMSTAYLDEAERCDSFLVLNSGRGIARGEPGPFADRLRGRVFIAHAERARRRALAQEIAHQPGVIDALLRGDSIRVVLESADRADAIAHLSGPMTPMPPRFEDALLDALHTQLGSPTPAPAPSASTDTPPIKDSNRDRVITIEHVCRDFGPFRAVEDFTETIRRGEVFGLLGANGAGKTTTFRMLCGLLAPTSGTLRVAGVNMRKAPAAARAKVGYMSQGFALYRELSVIRNLRFFAGAYNLRGTRLRERIQWAIDEFDLAAVLGIRSERLSLGFKQRLAFACALMHEPEVLFLDEPTSGVDPLARREFWRRIDALSARGVTVLVTTHFMEEAEYCDRVVIMVSGKVAAAGTPDDIRTRGGTTDQPCASMEDAFIALVGSNQPGETA